MKKPLILLASLALPLSLSLAADESSPPPARAQALSSDLAAALTAKLPKYNPPKPAAKSAAESDDAAASDLFANLPKPKNGIVRLPRVVVEGNRPPIFSERDIHTAEGLADLAVKRYFTSETALALNRFTLPLFGMGKEAYAMLLYDQDERLRLLDAYGKDAALLEALGDEDRAAELRDLLNDTLAHPTQFLNPAHAASRDARGQ